MHCITLWSVEHVTENTPQRINTILQNIKKNQGLLLYSLPPCLPPVNTVNVQNKLQSSDSSCAGSSPTMQISFQWFIMTFQDQINPEVLQVLLFYFLNKLFPLYLDIYSPHCAKTGQEKSVIFGSSHRKE